jgi:hypothetical protein
MRALLDLIGGVDWVVAGVVSVWLIHITTLIDAMRIDARLARAERVLRLEAPLAARRRLGTRPYHSDANIDGGDDA